MSELVTAVNGALEGCPAELPIDELVTHGVADNDGVKIHYATLGEGPLIVMLHGFPDYWYTIPGAGHFVQQDAADLVTRTMQSWLAQ